MQWSGSFADVDIVLVIKKKKKKILEKIVISIYQLVHIHIFCSDLANVIILHL